MASRWRFHCQGCSPEESTSRKKQTCCLSSVWYPILRWGGGGRREKSIAEGMLAGRQHVSELGLARAAHQCLGSLLLFAKLPCLLARQLNSLPNCSSPQLVCTFPNGSSREHIMGSHLCFSLTSTMVSHWSLNEALTSDTAGSGSPLPHQSPVKPDTPPLQPWEPFQSV